MLKKGEWVQIHTIILTPDQRAPQVPADTQEVPLEMWVKGFLLEDAEIGDEVEIETVTKRIAKGTLVQGNPTFYHSFGDFVPEIVEIDRMLQAELFGGER